MEKSWKNRLQEYCQKNKLPLPNYRVTQQTDSLNGAKFQVSILFRATIFTKEDRYNCYSMLAHWIDLFFRLKSKSLDIHISVTKIVQQKKKPNIQQQRKHILILLETMNYLLVENKISSIQQSLMMMDRSIYLPNILR